MIETNLIELIGTVAQALGPDVMRQYVNVDEAVKRLATSIGIDTANLVKHKNKSKQNNKLCNSNSLFKVLDLLL